MQKVRCGICVIISLLFCFSALSFGADYNFCVNAASDGNLIIHFLDVGQGDSIIVELPDGKTMLIDGGQVEYGSVVCEYLDGLGITTIDYLVATHSDSDHVGGLIEVLKNKDVKNIYRPFDLCRTIRDNGFVDELYTKFASRFSTDKIVDSAVYAEFLNLAYEEKVGEELASINICSTAVRFVSSSGMPYLVKFFNPVSKDYFTTNRIEKGYTVELTEDQNDTSAVIGIFTENHKYLFMADLPTTGETVLMNNLSALEREQLSYVTVLKVAHHGSEYSTSASLLNLTKPIYSVIQVGENDYGHPTSECLTRLKDAGSIIYRTDEDGTIIFEESYGKITIRTLGKEDTNISNYIIIGVLIVVVLGILLLAIFRNKIKLFFSKKKIGKIR